MNEAIKLAIEKGGYEESHLSRNPNWLEETTWEEYVLDPLFWQALCLAIYGHNKTPWKAIALEYLNHKLNDFSSIRSEDGWWEDLLNA
jgi:hypothetical protein